MTASQLAGRPERLREVTAAVLAQAPCFRNRDFPFAPLPVLLDSAFAESLREPLADYVALLGDVVRHFREHAEVRAWFGLPASAERLIAADLGPSDAPWVCRLDGYLDQDTERLVLLENNADAPAGTLFTSRVNATVRQVTELLAIETPGAAPPELSDLTYLPTRGEDRFLAALRAAALAAASRVTGKSTRLDGVAVLQPSDAASRESREIVAEFRSRGLDAYLADPRDLRVDRGEARFGDRAADLCWNKVNTVRWNDMATDPGFVRTWERALRDTPLVHVNPFAARYVAESKLCLAFVQDPQFADLFTDSQRRLAAALLPWTRRITPVATAADGKTSLLDELQEQQTRYVLKEPYDIRGDGVTIGADVSRSTWCAALSRAAADGAVAQKRVTPLRYPVLTAGSPRAESMTISLDSFLFGGQLAGFGSKASHNAKVNIFQGGRKLAVHVFAGGSP
ncbi:hypothetical protein FRAAL4660 [Frankia alni ACN14a]|uniref:Glutathionylspermidine synthase pre-ATP-grasp-like domain-containing protein n=1 Tax=Frankia alni (strain DSM 45986 / CECT 9034 / ACN14a) TaxID=326424 RepID=Q0RGT4_FRAAA|nr:hypothetical protein FRAAL4660 [Frankia alni ACN14a]